MIKNMFLNCPSHAAWVIAASYGRETGEKSNLLFSSTHY